MKYLSIEELNKRPPGPIQEAIKGSLTHLKPIFKWGKAMDRTSQVIQLTQYIDTETKGLVEANVQVQLIDFPEIEETNTRYRGLALIPKIGQIKSLTWDFKPGTEEPVLRLMPPGELQFEDVSPEVEPDPPVIKKRLAGNPVDQPIEAKPQAFTPKSALSGPEEIALRQAAGDLAIHLINYIQSLNKKH